MKRIILILLLLLSTAVPAYAAGARVDVDVPDKTDLTDEQYYVTVRISDNPGFASLQLELFYNTDVLSCVRVVPGEVVSGMLTDSNPKAGGKPAGALFLVAGTENTDKNGTLATFIFDKPGTGAPELDFSLTEIRTADGAAVECGVSINNLYDGTDGDPDIGGTDGDTDIGGGPTISGTPAHGTGTSAAPPARATAVPSMTPAPAVVPTEQPEQSAEPLMIFSDVSDGHWAGKYINEAVSLGIINGYTDGTFRPDNDMTRAEFATLLWNMNGRPDTDFRTPFDDTAADSWFYKQTAWCCENGYINGVSENEFLPDGKITREQAMTILYRYSGSPAAHSPPGGFADMDEISDFAVNAMGWAAENGIITGVDDTHIAPKANASRAQLSAIMVRFINNGLI